MHESDDDFSNAPERLIDAVGLPRFPSVCTCHALVYDDVVPSRLSVSAFPADWFGLVFGLL